MPPRPGARLHQRGEIWWIDPDFVVASRPGEAAVASEISKRRPAVVISSNAFLDQEVRIVVPFTSWKSKFDGLEFHYRVNADGTNNLGNDSSVNLLQVRCISVLRFDGFKGG